MRRRFAEAEGPTLERPSTPEGGDPRGFYADESADMRRRFAEAEARGPAGESPPAPDDVYPNAGSFEDLREILREKGPLRIGRYVFIDRLGEGAMGVVLAGYDPELDRRVAIKLIKAEHQDDPTHHQRMVREAQAMARLSHPNVVAVYEVGLVHGLQFVAMEYVKGRNLREWLAGCPDDRREVLKVFLQAGQGLAAAHRVGIIHRDFKPENVLIDGDGRVRVSDFGLARQTGAADEEMKGVRTQAQVASATPLSRTLTVPGAAPGTPAYMAPEQFAGEPADARSDQFSFCVALWEALHGERPFAGASLSGLVDNVTMGRRQPSQQGRTVPGWLRLVLERGLAVEPALRYSTMEALLAALRADPTRRRWMLAGLAAMAVAVAGGVGVQRYFAAQERHAREQQIAACEAEGASIFDVWNDEARARVRDGIVATGLDYAPVTAEKVMPYLDGQAEAWRKHRSQACVAAEVEGTLAAELSDRAVWCLDERQMELSALLTELAHADATGVQEAVTAAASLPPVSPCTDGQVLAALPVPPPVGERRRADVVRTMLSEARISLWTGDYPAGLKQTRTALADAKTLGWPPLIAAARQLEGRALEDMGDYAGAEAAAHTAYLEAAKVRAWDVAAAAANNLVYDVGYRQARHAEGRTWAGHAEVAVLFAGDPLGLREAHRLQTLAILHDVTGAYAEAKADHRRALTITEKALGPEHPRVAVSLDNLAIVHRATGAYAEAKALYGRALAIREQALGPEHPDVAKSLNNLAVVHGTTGAYAEAQALLERALAIREKALGSEHSEVAITLNNLANIHFVTGAYTKAKALHERSLAIKEKALGPEHPDVVASLHNLGSVHRTMGAHAEAKALYERALAVGVKSLGSNHPLVAASLGDLGGLAVEQRQDAEALPLLERALVIFDAHEGVQEVELETRFNLARALVRTGGDRTRALAEARNAAEGFREAGDGQAKELAEVEAFLAAPRPMTPRSRNRSSRL